MSHSLPVALDDVQIEELGREIDAIERDLKARLGFRDRRYIKRMIRIQRSVALGGRVLIFASLPLMPVFPLFLGVIGTGVAALGLAKILENMEIGHNVLHGQWDWMQDPEIHSSTWEWDNVCPADQWKHSHNVMHHTWTNVLGRDRDVGFDILRVTDRQAWHPAYLAQPVYNIVLALLFQWGVALNDVHLDAVGRGELLLADVRPQLAGIGRKARRQLLKDYVLWPALAGPWFLPVLLANASANLMRNLWSYAIIFCGHFPDGAHVFTEDQLAGETRARWYLRQILGSCNIAGGTLFHVLSGNLSHQIEHHLFPDLPSNRYAEAAVRVQAVCARFGVPYNRGSFARQLGTTLRTIFRLSLPTRARAQVA
jgi:linoleoyl-CoA desaturase